MKYLQLFKNLITNIAIFIIMPLILIGISGGFILVSQIFKRANADVYSSLYLIIGIITAVSGTIMIISLFLVRIIESYTSIFSLFSYIKNIDLTKVYLKFRSINWSNSFIKLKENFKYIYFLVNNSLRQFIIRLKVLIAFISNQEISKKILKNLDLINRNSLSRILYFGIRRNSENQ